MRESIIALLYILCLFISFKAWYEPLLHKIERLESNQRDYLQIYKNQRELIEQLKQEIKELKEDIYINK